MSKWNGKPSKKGTGFEQPLAGHQHWHIDVSYINISGTFYYLCSILDGCSRYIVNWDLRESMTEADIEIILERAKELHPEARPRIISDNGPQFIAKDFKEFIRVSGMTHVRTSPYYPQSNGKIERWHKSLKGECIRPGTPLSLEDARRLVEGYVEHYNYVRLNSAFGYITPKDMLAGRQQEIHAGRDRKLEEARKQRQIRRQRASIKGSVCCLMSFSVSSFMSIIVVSFRCCFFMRVRETGEAPSTQDSLSLWAGTRKARISGLRQGGATGLQASDGKKPAKGHAGLLRQLGNRKGHCPRLPNTVVFATSRSWLHRQHTGSSNSCVETRLENQRVRSPSMWLGSETVAYAAPERVAGLSVHFSLGASWPASRTCTRLVSDASGMRHSVEVVAWSLYEAAVLVLKEFPVYGRSSSPKGVPSSRCSGRFP